MKYAVIFLSSVLISSTSFAGKSEHKHSHKHRSHGAHVHGAGNLSLAFDGLVGKVEFKGPAEGIVGFEYEAKSEKDKKTLADAIAKFENETSKLVQFDPASSCTFAKTKVAMEAEDGDHSDFIAHFDVTCKKSILGTKVTFDFTSFSRLSNLDVTILVDDLTKVAKVRKRPVTLDLSK